MNSRSQTASKCLGIITEVVGYCVQKGTNHWKTDVRMDDEKATMTIVALDGTFTDHDVDFLHTQLNIPRQKDLEHMYWGLSGLSGGENKPYLFLSGIMVDEATVSMRDDGFYIEMIRFR